MDQLTFGMVESPTQRDTSAHAAAQIAPFTGNLRTKVLAVIVASGSRGITDEEGIAKLGIGSSTYRPRRVELHAGWQEFDGGYIEDSGRRRETQSGRTAAVWVATDKGIKAMREWLAHNQAAKLVS